MNRPAPTTERARAFAAARMEDLLWLLGPGRCGWGDICKRLNASPKAMHDFCKNHGRKDLAELFPVPPEPYKYHYRKKPTHKEREERRHG